MVAAIGQWWSTTVPSMCLGSTGVWMQTLSPDRQHWLAEAGASLSRGQTWSVGVDRLFNSPIVEWPPPGGEAAWWQRRHWELYLSDHLMQIVFQHIEVVVWFGFLGGHSLVLPLCCWVAQWNGELQPWKDSRRNRQHHSRAGQGVPVWPVWTGLV